MDTNDKTESNSNVININFQVKEETNSNSNASSIPTPSAVPKKKPVLNFGDCGHPPNTIQQYGFAGGH
jgi:hypothetical protein